MQLLAQAPIKPIPIQNLNPAKYNPRRKLKPGDKEYEDIRQSLTQWGLVVPLVFNKRTGTLVGGHQRLNVIKREMPETTEVECAVIDVELDQEKALNVVLNRVGERLWSDTKLKSLLAEIEDRIDVSTLGFSEDEIKDLMKRGAGRTAKRDTDDAPKPPSKPITKPGDIYHLMGPDGNPQHRVRCGDSTNSEGMDELMGDRRAHAVITDPPYGVSYVSQSKSGKMARQEIKNDELRGTVLQEFLRDCFSLTREHTHPNAALYCFYASRCHIEFEQAMREAEWEVRQQLIWAKRMALGRSNYHWAHEPILYAAKQGESLKYHGDRAQTTILQDDQDPIETIKGMSKADLQKALTEITEAGTVLHCKQEPPSTYIHPTQKPVALIGKMLKHATLPGQDVYDPFLGSGSCLIAAEIEGRNCFGQEMEPGHVDAIVRRYVETFEEVLIYRNGKEINPTTLQQAN